MSTGSKTIADLPEAEVLDDKDQFLFFQNSTKKTKKITRNNMLNSRGFVTALQAAGVGASDTVAPNTPALPTVTTATERDKDGTEKVYIKASVAANSETDLASYSWSLRRASGITPIFAGGYLSSTTSANGNGEATSASYSGTAQIFDAVTNVAPAPQGQKMQWDVRANAYYEVRVSAIDKSGNRSSYTALTGPSGTVILSARDTSPPDPPTIVTANSAIKSVFLDWVNDTAADLAGVKIYRNTLNNFSTATLKATVYATSFTDTSTVQGTSYYYWLTSIDYSGNESTTQATPYTFPIVPGLVANTDITTFAVDATKMTTNIIVLKADALWTDNSNNGTANSAPGYIYWSAHTLVYGGASYSITAGSTNLQFVYWTGGTTYQVSDTNPALTDGQFMIATNAKNAVNIAQGIHDLAWNAMANAVIGSAYIQNAAITNAKISELNADKIRTGSITSQTITLDSGGVFKSSGVASFASGIGFWLEGGATSKFGIGDLSGDTYGSLKWDTSANTLTVKGEIKATSGFFGSANTAVSVGNLGLSVGTTGRITSGLEWSSSGAGNFTPSGSGFFLGYASSQYRFFLGQTGTTGTGGANYLYWNGASLEIKGAITATSLTLSGSATGFASSHVGLGNVENLSAQDQAKYGIEATITLASGGIAMGEGGFVRGAIEWDSVNSRFTGASGFFLGRATSQYRFFIGSTGNPGTGSGNYLYWDGTTLKMGGNIVGGTTVGTAGDGAYGLTIQSGYGLRYYTNAGVLTITGGNANGADNAAQIDLAGNSYNSVNRGSLILAAGYVSSWLNPSDLNSGSIHFRTHDSLVGLWRSNKTFEIYSDVSIQTNLYVGDANPNLAPFKVVGGVVTASGMTLTGGVVSATTKIGGVSGVLASVVDSTVADDGNIVTPNFDTAAKTILDTFSFASKGGQDYISAIKVGEVTWNANSGVIDSGVGKTGVIIYKGGIIGVKDGVAKFSLNGATGDATFAGNLSAPTGNIGGFTILTNQLHTGSKSTFASALAGVYVGTDGIALGENSPFSVTSAGALTATSATITGAITATSGFIGTAAGGFAIDSTYIRKGDKTSYNSVGTGVYIGTDGIGLGTAFTVAANGALTATSVTVTGSVTANAGNIAGTTTVGSGSTTAVTIGNSINTSGNLVTNLINSKLDTSAAQIKDGFSFTTNGALNITGSGTANIKISPAGIVATNESSAVTFTLNGTTGAATFAGNLSAPTGNIGGFTIGATSLTAGSSGTAIGMATTGGYAFFAGNASAASAPFRVTDTGQLVATGAAINGLIIASSGRIGTAADGFVISSSSFYKNKATLDAVDAGVYVGTDGISLGPNSVFKVTSSGVLTATSATISGAITATSGSFTGSITSASGTIGGFTILSGQLHTGSKSTFASADAGVYVGTDGIALGTSSPFKVTSAGALTATNATISGAITATSGSFTGSITSASGTIGGFTILSGQLHTGSKSTFASADAGVYVGTDGIALGTSSPFKVTSTGVLTASSGTIGGWTLAASKLSAGNIEIDAAAGAQKIQAGPSAATYVRISSAGIIGVDAVLGTVFNLPTNGSRPTFSSGEITSTKFVVSTQGVIRTSETVGNSPTSGAGILINDVGIRGYAANQAVGSPNFQLDASNGHITARAGTVGGWTLSASSLIGGSGASRVGLEVDSTAGNVAIYAGGETKGSAPFRVTNTGVLTATSATISGAITATSFTLSGGIQIPFGGVAGLGALAAKESVDLTTAEVTNKSLANIDSNASTKLATIATGADVTLSQINGGLSLTGGGLFVSSTAQIRTSNITWTQGTQIFTQNVNGFFLGDAKAANSTTTHRFFIGHTGTTGTGGTNYLYWDGSTLNVGGTIVGGTNVGTAGDTDAGLTINSPYGIRQGNASNQGILTITGGNANGIQSGAQIDLCGSAYSGAGGMLILQAGSGGSSEIRLSTNTFNNQAATQVGVIRAAVKNTGLFEIQRNPGSRVSGNQGTEFNTNAGNLYVYSNVGIGMAPAQTNTTGITDEGITGKLYVSNQVILYNSNVAKLTLTASNGNVSSAGDVSALSFTTSSSKKVKTNIKKLNSGLEMIEKLKPVSFKRKGANGKNDIGLIAEEVDKILPVIVKHNDKNEAEGLDYSKLTVILINAVKELSAEVKELKKKLKDANTN